MSSRLLRQLLPSPGPAAKTIVGQVYRTTSLTIESRRPAEAAVGKITRINGPTREKRENAISDTWIRRFIVIFLSFDLRTAEGLRWARVMGHFLVKERSAADSVSIALAGQERAALASGHLS